jgi:hypothetical protein
MEDFDFAARGLDPERYLTRDGICELAEKTLGIPLPRSTLNKAAMRGKGPPVDAVVGNAPVALPSKDEAIHDRAWWAAESERLGTDWQSLGQVVARLITHLPPCPTCGATPCLHYASQVALNCSCFRARA